MSDPHDDVVPTGRDSRAEASPPASALRPELEEHRSLLELLQLDADRIVDALCSGTPRDIVGECREHVADHAYFIEEDRVAAKAIAQLASLAGATAERARDALDGLVELATTEAIEEGPLASEAASLVDDPHDDDPPLIVRLSRGLGVSIERVLRLIPRLNALEYEDRHVVYHCLVERMSPRAYAERFDDDPKIVQEMIAQVARLAAEG